MTKREAVFTKDKANKKITVVRSFDASLDQVWKAWTTSEILDQWWAPRPYKAETKSMDFRTGGMWLYCMAGPEGDRNWCRVDYKAISPQQSITSAATFCDEDGNINTEFPVMHWQKEFRETADGTTVHVDISFDREEDMEMIVGMGFEGGFTMGLNNLDEYLAAQ